MTTRQRRRGGGNKLSQKEKVFYHMFLNKKITKKEAIEIYGIKQLGTNIAVLRKEGYEILSKREGRFYAYYLPIT